MPPVLNDDAMPPSVAANDVEPAGHDFDIDDPGKRGLPARRPTPISCASVDGGASQLRQTLLNLGLAVIDVAEVAKRLGDVLASLLSRGADDVVV